MTTRIMSICIEPETASFSSVLSQADLVKLQSWFSPSFPVGGFSYSHGLEWIVEAREVQDARSLTQWIAGVLRHGAARSDAILLCGIWRAIQDEDWREVTQISDLAAVLQPTAERRLESLSQGTAFLAAVSAGWTHPVIERFSQSCSGSAAYPVAAGVAAAAHALPLPAVLVACLHAFAANLVSAGIRLVPLGQTDGIRVTASLEPVLIDVAREAHGARLDELGSASMLADIASMLHETQYTRLFRS